MGSKEGLRFHLKATHTLPDEIIDGMCELQESEYGVARDSMEAVARIHHALHEAVKVVRELVAVENGTVTCTECGQRPAVVILTTARYCRPCALIAGDKIGRGFRG